MAGCTAGDLEWGPEGSLTRFIADEIKKVIKAMLRSGWRPYDPLDAQREWLASKVQLYVQDKQKQASEHLEAQTLANRTILPTLSEPPSAPPSPTWDWRGSWTTQAPGNQTRV
ncbi:hypothetical protein chiPu_0031669 [Chiloscyllium punctatum]|uniref:Uncharacterized protein n=1 Tax=Chiloscyllium punctatum TaxID=137246 RepID=A0A401TXU2_CHIPU|nr:hypothetical protein [Chiloscyllium punctatum]